jgi:hypothetical protein
MKSIRTFAIALTVVMLAVGTSAAATSEGAAGDGKTSISYDSATGAFGIQPDGQPVGLFDIRSATSIFNSTPATLPPGGLGLDVNTAARKSWAALPAAAINADFNLGNIAATGLTKAFLLGDLTLVGSGGFGTNNRDLDLVYVGGTTGTAPVVTDFASPDRIQGAQISHQFAATGDPVPTWGSLTPVAGNPTPAIVPTLSAAGLFTWNSAGSPYGNYAWDVTATNSVGSDVGRFSVELIIPEPATISLVGLSVLGLVGLFGRRR